MGFGVYQVFTASMATGTSLTGSYDLGRTFAQMYLTVPNLASFCVTATCNIFIQGSADNSTFYRVAFPPVNSSTSGSNDFQIANNVSQRMVPIPTGFRYYQVEASNSMTGAVAFKMVCADY